MTASGPLYLAIDQGGHASRAFVYDAAGRAIGGAAREVRLLRHADGRMEYDAAALLASVRGAVEDAVAGLAPADRRRLRAAGLATQRANTVCWDRVSGEPLSPLISWQDRRGQAYLPAQAHAAEIRRITGLAPSAHYGAGKLRWCLDHLPRVRTALEAGRLAWGPMASFLLFHLLEERPLRADPVNAARTLLWDLEGNDWSPRMLTLFALPREPLPAPAPNRWEYGTLAAGSVRVPLNLCTGDQNAALHAAGAPRDDTLYVTLGTGAFVLRGAGAAPPAPSRLLNGLVHGGPGQPSLYALEGTVNGAGSALDWLQARTGAGDLVARLPEWLDAPGEPPLFLNGVSGLGTPYMVPAFEPRFLGAGGTAAQAVAVVESIVFLLQVNIEEIEGRLPAAARIRAGGGLSRYDGLCRRLASLSGKPVLRASTPETTGLGLARLLAGADRDDAQAGGHSDHRMRAPDRDAAAGAPEYADRCFDPGRDERLTSRYRRWRAALEEALHA